MKTLQFFLLVSFLICVVQINAQENNFQRPLSINSSGEDPDTSSILDIQSQTKGILIPRMSSTDRLNIASGNPPLGLMVFDTTTNSFWYYDSLQWQEVNTTNGWAYYYLDNDGDGFGDIAGAVYTNAPLPNYVTNNTDCDDSNINVNPVATEICNGIDDNCDNLIDDADPSISGQMIWYQDSDADLYGNPNVDSLSCGQPVGYVQNNNDCDDTEGSINPDANEICDSGVDNDCNGLADDNDPSITGQSTWYQDLDADLYGNSSVDSLSCDQPVGYVQNSGDCNDEDFNINPDATEDCNGIDDDCNGIDDDNLTPPPTTLQDGVCAGATQVCTGAGGWVDDYSGLPNYEAVETICDGLDNDCDGMVDEPFDFNSDTLNCGGCGIVCDDSLDCTVNNCQAGVCDFSSLVPLTCFIAGVCYSDGEPEPGNECRICDPNFPTQWSNAEAGTFCTGGLCDGGGTCVAN